MPEYSIQMAEPQNYCTRLRRGVALLEPIAFSLEKNEFSAADHAEALYGAMEYLRLLSDELDGSLRASRGAAP